VKDSDLLEINNLIEELKDPGVGELRGREITAFILRILAGQIFSLEKGKKQGAEATVPMARRELLAILHLLIDYHCQDKEKERRRAALDGITAMKVALS
jgi:hypothetical protein